MKKFKTMGRTVSLPALLVAALAALALAGSVACSGDSGDDECAEDADCDGSESCVDGVCQTENPDAGNNDPDDNVEAEDYYVSYTKNDGQDRFTLWLYSTADEEHQQISPDGLSCQHGCWLTDDLNHMVWRERNEESGYDVYKAQLNDDLEVEGSEEELAVGVRGTFVVGNVLSYSREDSGLSDAFYMDVTDGEEKRVGPLNPNSATRGWALDPRAGQAVMYEPAKNGIELQLDFEEFGEIISGSADVTLDGDHYQRTGGSYYSSSMPVGFSPDGELVAFAVEAPNAYQSCETDDDCTGPGQSCGHEEVCTVLETTVHIVELEEADDLGRACGGPGTCGDVHECYMPDGEEDISTATCIPARVTVGLPNIGSQDGCALTEGNQDYYYTEVNGPISFDDRGNLYLVGSRDCDDLGDIGHTDILKIDPETGDHEIVWGNSQDGGFVADDCWDFDADEPSDEDCGPYIRSARLSPEYNELAVEATNPYVDLPPSAVRDRAGLWTVLRNGEDHAWSEGVQSSSERISNVAVHPMP